MQILPNCALIPRWCETCTCAKAIDKLTQRYASPTRKIVSRNWNKTDNIRLYYVNHASAYQFQCLKN